MNEIIVHIADSQITNKKAVKKFFDELKDGKYLLSAKSIKRRSLQQNAYLHGVVIPMVYEGLRNNGFDEVQDHEDAKLIIKALFLKKKMSNGSETIDIIKETSKLTTVEMMEFVDAVIKWAAEYLQIQIPLPGEQSIMFAQYDYDINATIID